MNCADEGVEDLLYTLHNSKHLTYGHAEHLSEEHAAEVMSKLEDRGIVSSDGTFYHVQDEEALQEIIDENDLNTIDRGEPLEENR